MLFKNEPTISAKAISAKVPISNIIPITKIYSLSFFIYTY